jgi:formamidopyrimidine-DNA glycosylase
LHVDSTLTGSLRDEVLYNARIHPEQYSNTLSPKQVKQLHKSIQYVCGFAVDNLADSSTFPEDWLFKHRWGKGKKDRATKLPNGDKFVFLTVGGRTSCVVPSVQKKTGPVAKDIEDEAEENVKSESEKEEKPAKRKRVPKAKDRERTVDDEAEPVENGDVNGVAHNEDEAEQASKPASKKRKSNGKAKTEDAKVMKTNGRRRSTRMSGKGL